MSMDHTNGSCHLCAMAAADHDVNNNNTRSGSVPWQRPRRVPLFWQSYCRVLHVGSFTISPDPNISLKLSTRSFNLVGELHNSIFYIGITANVICPCLRESYLARKTDVTKDIGPSHITTQSSCIACRGISHAYQRLLGPGHVPQFLQFLPQFRSPLSKFG